MKTVAWMGIRRHGETRVSIEKLANDDIPLYTHPADESFDRTASHMAGKYVSYTKELTDEEKWEVFTNLARSPDLRADMIRFADSILRKAQE